ncbi:MAG TPA: hypothetical protein VN778_04795 [Verrucomicrobiae bacterium]|nr:hypothetical protein [Verrucomicrobiae bacterium]
MNTSTNSSLYDELVNVTHQYFGPAANRFVTRQISNHLSKDPELLKKKDLKALIDWISVAMALLVEDEKLVNKYIADLKELADGSSK